MNSDFMVKMSPHLETLLRLSLSLTKNGRDAVRLMREAIAEASPFWRDWVREQGTDVKLYEILTRRFFGGFEVHPHNLVVSHAEWKSEFMREEERASAGRGSSESVESDAHAQFYRGIVGLPERYRLAMFLSYVEGFPTTQIAELSSIQPQAVEALLNRGCGLLRDELFAVVLGSYGVESVLDQEAKSA
ncbi:MAG: sigma factor-like helix-turn-helix DNA-binding protein [Candidatus Zixiibacteriota bacterium]